MWKRDGNRVYGYGQSYRLENIETAKKLHVTLKEYESRLNKVKEAIVLD